MEDLIMQSNQELDSEMLLNFINKHRASLDRFKKLKKAYETKYEIFDQKKKEDYKPDNRLAVNYAKYIVDTMNGFFIGNSVKVGSFDKEINDYVVFLNKLNDSDDTNFEISKMCSIFGICYEVLYVDENKNIRFTYDTPLSSFMIFDNSIDEKPLYYVRYDGSVQDVVKGMIYSSATQKEFVIENENVRFEDEVLHGFNELPAIRYVENAEKMSIFEPVLSLINNFNKSISEKANDVDYFADAYLKVLGAYLEEEDLKKLRDNRVINFGGADADKIVVEFLQKPNGDVIQENLLNRLEDLIFKISMVADISDKNFGSSSGIALKYKLQGMNNLAKNKERKFVSGLNQRYKIIFSSMLNKFNADDWIKVYYQFTYNYPANDLEESEVVKNLNGIVSKKTQLKIVSSVDDPEEELKEIQKENDYTNIDNDYIAKRVDTNE